MAADDERGKRKRAMRGFFSHHLGLGCTVEVDRWAAAECKRLWSGTALAAAVESSGGRGKWLWRCEAWRAAAVSYL
jgi:hypothetical protein